MRDSNPRMPGPKPGALPLGESPVQVKIIPVPYISVKVGGCGDRAFGALWYTVGMKQIESVIFDVGGVLHENNTAVTQDLMNELGLSPDAIKQIWAEQIPLLGSGRMTEQEFWCQVQLAHGIRPVDPAENLLGRAFAENLVPYPQIGRIVKELGQHGVVTAVLSNTIKPHARALRGVGLCADFTGPVMLSHEIGIRKPDEQIYSYALEQLGRQPGQVMFIDDDERNVAVARKLGMNGVVFNRPEQLRAELQEYFPWLTGE